MAKTIMAKAGTGSISIMANSTLKTVRTVLWTLVAVAGAGAGWLWYSQANAPQPATRSTATADYSGQSQFGAGDYRLVAHTGETVDDSVFTGQPSAVFFGFTHCPDVCPTTLADMQHWFAELGDEGEALRAFFVSVDPERDTPEVLGQYVGWVSDRITGLTGEPDEVAKAADAWGVFAERVPLDDGGYTVNHTASVFLVDSQGGFFGTIAYGEDPDTAVAKLRRLMAEG